MPSLERWMIPRSEQKRQQKAAEKAAEKQAKAPAAESGVFAATLVSVHHCVCAEDGGKVDEEMDPSKYFELRSAAIEAAKARGEQPYPHKFHVSLSIKAFIHKVGVFADAVCSQCVQYEHLKNDETHADVVSIAGRVYNKRSASRKLHFYDLRGEGVKVQVLAQIE
jgi:lysyl-tRNA synthetase class 2